MKFSIRIALTLSTAVLFFLSFPPLNLFPLSWISFVPFFFALRNTSRPTHFKLGWILSFSMTALGFYWIVYTMQEFGQLPLWLSLILFGIYALFASSHITLFSFFLYELTNRKRKPLPPFWNAGLTAALFVAFEYVVPQLFPWLIGHSQRGNFYFIQIADLTGTYLISFLILFANRLIYLTFTQPYQKTRLVWGGFLVVILVSYGYGYLRVQTIQHVMAKAQPIKIGMAQTNVGNLDKVMAQYGVAEALQKSRENYEALVRKAGEARPDLIVL